MVGRRGGDLQVGLALFPLRGSKCWGEKTLCTIPKFFSSFINGGIFGKSLSVREDRGVGGGGSIKLQSFSSLSL